MAFSKSQAVTAVREILVGARAAEEPRLELIARAMRQPSSISQAGDGEFYTYDSAGQPCAFPVLMPRDAPKVMKQLALKSDTNFLSLLVKTFAQAMKVEGYYSKDAQGRLSPSASGWAHWQRNRMDAYQTGIHRAALKYGVAYESVLPGDVGPVLRGFSPRRMTAVYQDPAFDEWPMLSLDVDGSMLTLMDEERVYRIGAENAPRGGYEIGSRTRSLAGSQLEFIDSFEHGAGVCPVVRFRDRTLLDGEEQLGIVEPVLTIQSRINETSFEMMVAQFFAAFRQRYVMGWVPTSEADEMRASASDVWYFDSPDVKVGQFEETDLTRYIGSKASALRDFAAIGQIPAQNLGIDGISNISQETLAGLEAGKEREVDEITTSLGESHEQALRLCAHLSGDVDGAADYASQVRWKDESARSFAQTVDGLVKLATLDIPKQLLWEKIPNWSDTDTERAVGMLAASPSDAQLLADALTRQQSPAV